MASSPMPVSIDSSPQQKPHASREIGEERKSVRKAASVRNNINVEHRQLEGKQRKCGVQPQEMHLFISVLSVDVDFAVENLNRSPYPGVSWCTVFVQQCRSLENFTQLPEVSRRESINHCHPAPCYFTFPRVLCSTAFLKKMMVLL